MSSVDYKVGGVISDIATPITHPEELQEYAKHGGINRLVQPTGLLTREGTEYRRDNSTYNYTTAEYTSTNQ